MPLEESNYLELITLAEAKTAAKVQHTQEDDFFKMLIVASIQTAEKFCSTDFIRKTKTRTLKGVSDMPSWYPLKGRYIEVTEVKRVSGSTETVLTDSAYTFSIGADNLGGILSFPFYTTTREEGYRYLVSYESGYDPADFIEITDLKAALLQLIVYWYKNREAVVVGTITEGMPLSATMTLQQYIDYSTP